MAAQREVVHLLAVDDESASEQVKMESNLLAYCPGLQAQLNKQRASKETAEAIRVSGVTTKALKHIVEFCGFVQKGQIVATETCWESSIPVPLVLEILVAAHYLGVAELEKHAREVARRALHRSRSMDAIRDSFGVKVRPDVDDERDLAEEEKFIKSDAFRPRARRTPSKSHPKLRFQDDEQAAARYDESFYGTPPAPDLASTPLAIPLRESLLPSVPPHVSEGNSPNRECVLVSIPAAPAAEAVAIVAPGAGESRTANAAGDAGAVSPALAGAPSPAAAADVAAAVAAAMTDDAPLVSPSVAAAEAAATAVVTVPVPETTRVPVTSALAAALRHEADAGGAVRSRGGGLGGDVASAAAGERKQSPLVPRARGSDDDDDEDEDEIPVLAGPPCTLPPSSPLMSAMKAPKATPSPTSTAAAAGPPDASSPCDPRGKRGITVMPPELTSSMSDTDSQSTPHGAVEIEDDEPWPMAQPRDIMSASIWVHKRMADEQQQQYAPRLFARDRRPEMWVPDHYAPSCYSCSTQFGTLTRKHHCRSCGRVFCSSCIKEEISLPRDLQTFPEERFAYTRTLKAWWFPTDKEKLCQRCLEEWRGLADLRVKTLICGFEYAGLTVFDLRRIAHVGHPWYIAATFCMSSLRWAHYRLPGHEFSEREKMILWNNRKLFVGHSRWLVSLMKVVDWSDPARASEAVALLSKPQKYSCRSVLCSQLCKAHKLGTSDCPLGADDAVELLTGRFADEGLRRAAVDGLRASSEDELCCYIPTLVRLLQYEPLSSSPLFVFLHARAQQHALVCSELYWALKVVGEDPECQAIVAARCAEELRTLVKNNASGFYPDLERGTRFVTMLRETQRTIRTADPTAVEQFRETLATNLKRFNIFSEHALPLPINPEIRAISIDVEKVKVKTSHARPIVLPMHLTTRGRTYEMMYKPDSMVTDQMCLNVIRLMDKILTEETEIKDYHLVTYRVLPTSTRDGLCEFVPNALTLFDATESGTSTLTAWLLDNEPAAGVKERFCRSFAVYCVITFLLGVGDRHLENLMITRDGRMFHIDYGYILGANAKVFTKIFTHEESVKITKEMMEVVGSKTRKQMFHHTAQTAFNCLRKHAGLFMILLNAENDLALAQRFLPGHSDEEASAILAERLNANSDAWPLRIVDIWHQETKPNSFSASVVRGTYDSAVGAATVVASAASTVAGALGAGLSAVGSFLPSFRSVSTPPPSVVSPTTPASAPPSSPS